MYFADLWSVHTKQEGKTNTWKQNWRTKKLCWTKALKYRDQIGHGTKVLVFGLVLEGSVSFNITG